MENELRLNNWISVQFDQRKEIQVTVTNIEKLVNYGPEILMRGIPITEEWLVKFGFIKEPQNVSYAIVYKKEIVTDLETLNFTIIHVIGKYLCLQFYNYTKFLYVHQLQNLFHCLVGKELIIINK